MAVGWGQEVQTDRDLTHSAQGPGYNYSENGWEDYISDIVGCHGVDPGIR